VGSGTPYFLLPFLAGGDLQNTKNRPQTVDFSFYFLCFSDLLRFSFIDLWSVLPFSGGWRLRGEGGRCRLCRCAADRLKEMTKRMGVGGRSIQKRAGGWGRGWRLLVLSEEEGLLAGVHGGWGRKYLLAEEGGHGSEETGNGPAHSLVGGDEAACWGRGCSMLRGKNWSGEEKETQGDRLVKGRWQWRWVLRLFFSEGERWPFVGWERGTWWGAEWLAGKVWWGRRMGREMAGGAPGERRRVEWVEMVRFRFPFLFWLPFFCVFLSKLPLLFLCELKATINRKHIAWASKLVPQLFFL